MHLPFDLPDRASLEISRTIQTETGRSLRSHGHHLERQERREHGRTVAPSMTLPWNHLACSGPCRATSPAQRFPVTSPAHRQGLSALKRPATKPSSNCPNLRLYSRSDKAYLGRLPMEWFLNVLLDWSTLLETDCESPSTSRACTTDTARPFRAQHPFLSSPEAPWNSPKNICNHCSEFPSTLTLPRTRRSPSSHPPSSRLRRHRRSAFQPLISRQCPPHMPRD